MSLVESIRRDWYRPANVISGLRLLLAWVPAVMLLSYPEDATMRWWAVGVFLFVALTDALDGHVARRFNQVTEWGKFLDPLVDKVLVVVMLVAISILEPNLWGATILIVLREVVVTLMLRSRGVMVPAVWSGKVKMALQVAMILAWMIPLGEVLPGMGWQIVQVTVTFAAVWATIWSWADSYKRFIANRPLVK